MQCTAHVAHYWLCTSCPKPRLLARRAAFNYPSSSYTHSHTDRFSPVLPEVPAHHTIHNNSLQFLSSSSPSRCTYVRIYICMSAVDARISVFVRWNEPFTEKQTQIQLNFSLGNTQGYIVLLLTTCGIIASTKYILVHVCASIRQFGATTTYISIDNWTKFSQTKTKMKMKMLWNEQANKYITVERWVSKWVCKWVCEWAGRVLVKAQVGRSNLLTAE